MGEKSSPVSGWKPAVRTGRAESSQRGRSPVRPSEPPTGGPRPRPDHSHLSLEELRAYRAGLHNEENQISYLRRVVQARIDLLESTGADQQDLARYGVVFDRATAGPGSLLRQMLPPDEVPRVPPTAGLWDKRSNLRDPAVREHLLNRLRDAERQLSAYRAVLHHHLDAATTALILRYREDPAQSLDLLPQYGR